MVVVSVIQIVSAHADFTSPPCCNSAWGARKVYGIPSETINIASRRRSISRLVATTSGSNEPSTLRKK